MRGRLSIVFLLSFLSLPLLRNGQQDQIIAKTYRINLQQSIAFVRSVDEGVTSTGYMPGLYFAVRISETKRPLYGNLGVSYIRGNSLSSKDEIYPLGMDMQYRGDNNQLIHILVTKETLTTKKNTIVLSYRSH